MLILHWTILQDQVQRTLAHKLVGYALGRTLQLSDQPLVDALVADGSQAGFSRLVGEIVASKQFRNRVTQEDTPASAPQRADAQAPKNSSANKVGGR